MRVLITGVAGFLGSHLADRFLALGHEVVGVDNMIGGNISNIPDGVIFLQLDCCDFDSMKLAMTDVEMVVHAAATAHEGLSVFSPSFITRNIYEASVATISAAVSSGVKRFIFCSSMARYGNGNPPFKETDPSSPVDPYGIAKVAAEQTLKVLAEVHGMEYNIVVPHNIIGPRQNYTDPYRNVLSIMLNRSLSNKPIYIYGDGEQIRCFSYVDECVESIERVCFDTKIQSQVINIGPDSGEVTINELANLVLTETGSNLTPIHIDGRPQEVKYAYCSSIKARQLLEYKQKTTLSVAITETANWIRAQGPAEFSYKYPLEIITEKTPKTWSERKM